MIIKKEIRSAAPVKTGAFFLLEGVTFGSREVYFQVNAFRTEKGREIHGGVTPEERWLPGWWRPTPTGS